MNRYESTALIKRSTLLMVQFAMNAPMSEWGSHDELSKMSRDATVWETGFKFADDAEVDVIVRSTDGEDFGAWAEVLLFKPAVGNREDGRGRAVYMEEVQNSVLDDINEMDIEFCHEGVTYVASLKIDSDFEEALQVRTLRSVRALGKVERAKEAYAALARLSILAGVEHSEVARFSPEEALHTVLGLIKEAAPVLDGLDLVFGSLMAKSPAASTAGAILEARELALGVERLREGMEPSQEYIDNLIAFGEGVTREAAVSWPARLLVLSHLGTHHDSARWIDDDVHAIIEGIMQSEADQVRDAMDTDVSAADDQQQK